jgi:uncharacterized protein YjdB/outer membrane murein-binding lipoprotein Lpp
MKKIFFAIAAAAMMFVGCTKELTQRVDNLESGLSSLQAKVEALEKSLNSEVAGIKTILDALKAKVYVTSVTETANGYEILFTDGKKATITNGKDGKDGANGTNGTNGKDGKDGVSPVVGIAAGEDGVLYWTVNGEFVLVAGAKVPATGAAGSNGAAGADAPVPSFEIDENGHLWVTVGETKTDLGKVVGETGATGAQGPQGPVGPQGAQGDAWFKGVDTTNPAFVVITLNDEAETKITLPVYNEFDIVFATAELPAAVGTEIVVPYTVTGAEKYTVRAHASEGVWAQVNAKENTITISFAEVNSVADAYVYVTVTENATGAVVVKCLSFTAGVLEVAEGLEIPAEGGSASIEVTTDLEYEVVVEDAAANWLKYVGTKATRTDVLTFAAEAHPGATRTAEVSLVVDDVTVATFTVTQRILAETLTVAPETLVLPVFGEEKFTVSVTPADADQNVIWTLPSELVMDGNFIKVNPEAIAAGYANIIAGKTFEVVATSASNSKLTATLAVEVSAVMVEEIDIPAPKEYIAARVGQIVPLEWTVLPENASDKTVTFASTNEKVITVDENGIVTVVGPGEAKVIITSNDQFCTLAEDPTAYVAPSADVVFAVSKELAASSIAFPAEAVKLPVSGKVEIAPTVGPEDAADASVAYEILLDGKTTSDLVVIDGKVQLNPALTTVADKVGKVGKTYTVVASLVSNPTITDELDVTVTAVLVESLTAEAFTTKMGLEEYTAAPAVTVNPAEADDKTLYWTIESGADVIEVDAETGVITPIKPGYASVRATAYDGYNTNYEAKRVSVVVPVTVLYEDGQAVVNAIKFLAESYDFAIAKDATLDLASEVALDPSLKDAKLVWSVELPNHFKAGYDSTAESAYAIDAKGVVSVNNKYWTTDGYPSLMSGFYYMTSQWMTYDNSLKVTVASEKDPAVKATAKVNIVVVPVEEVTFGIDKLDMFVGKTVQIKPTILPENATVKAAYKGYTSSNTNVVTVDAEGNLVAVAEGEAVVTYSAANPFGNKMEVKGSVLVVVGPNAPKEIKTEKAEVEVVLGETVDLPTVAGLSFVDAEATTSHDVKWSIVNRYGKTSAFATVTEDGKVTITDFNTYGVNNPDNVYTVTVASVIDETVKAEIAVKVTVVMPKAIEWGAEVTTMTVGQEFPQIIKYISAKEGYEVTYQEVRYESSNTSVLKIENGKIVAVGAAEAVTLTCYYNGKYAPVDENGNPVYKVEPISMTFAVLPEPQVQ